MRMSRVCMGLAVLLVSLAVFAADRPEPVLPEIVVTPLRSDSDIQSVPVTAYRLPASSAVRDQAARTTPDAIRGLPSVMVQKTSQGQGSPFLRGFTGFRTLCLVDGIRLNNSVFRDGPNQYWNTVDPLSIRAYELVMGPASVLYGSDAVGGVLNALPIEPPGYSGKPTWQRTLVYRGATADRSTVGRIQLAGRPSEELGFVGGVSLKEFGDVRGGGDVGRQEKTGYDETDVDGRVDYHLGDRSVLTLGHQSVRQNDAWRTHRTIYGIDWEGLTHGDDKVLTYDQSRDLSYLRLKADDLRGVVDAADVVVSRHAQGEDLYRVKKDDKADGQGFDVETWGAAAQLSSDSAVGDWVYGAEYYHDSVSSYSRKYGADGRVEKADIQGPVGDDASVDSLGVYVQDTVSLFDGGLDVIPGARYTYARAEAGRVKDPVTGKATSIEDDWDAVAGSLRILRPIVPDRSLVAFAGVAQGFRAPNLSDLSRLDIARSGELETAAPGLDPEEYLAGEIGLKARTERVDAQVSYYYTVIDNLIVRAPTGRLVDDLVEVTKKNSGDGYVQGAELSTTYRFSSAWSAWLNLSWMDGAVDAYPTSASEQERDSLSRLLPPTAQAGVRWQADGGTYWFEGLGDMAAKADKLSAEDERDTQRIPPGGTPGYAVFTLRGGAQLTDALNVALSVENLLNEDYRIHGSGVNEPGRNVILTASCSF